MDIQTILLKMTLEEKARLCSGLDAWHTKPVERLNIPSIMVADGPHGLRKEQPSTSIQDFMPSYPATCFPTASALACSWDRELLFEIGNALGEECLQEEVSVILGPGTNIKRSPLCGRNFEYFSEDPYLSGEMAIQHIKGVQSQGIGTSLKHFAGNNQEFRRMSIDAVIDERALREIYLSAFEKAVKEAQPWTVMCAYNRLNGSYCSENGTLLNDILREEWGFSGLVMSDWGAVNQRVAGLSAGLDLEMPGGNPENDNKIIQAVQNGELYEAILDRSVERLLKLIDRGEKNKRTNFRYDPRSHHTLTRKAAAECMVLLKNEENILPLDAEQKIAVIGDFAKKPRYQGYGSSVINPTYLDCALDELKKYVPNPENITYTEGYLRDDSAIRPDLVQAACEVAKQATVVIVFLGLPESYETEGIDREDMRLPENQNQFIQELVKANPNIVVVLSNGSPVEMPWAVNVKGIVEAYLSGQAGGGAIADVLFGVVNPSGKLAETFPLKLEDNPSYHSYPGGPQTVEYRESIYVGYRYYDKVTCDVLFPFGHGLSYTSFAYENLQVSKKKIEPGEEVEVNCILRNTGKREGKEVVQLYAGRADTSGFFALRELKDFVKVSLKPGESKKVTLHLNERSFAYYDVQHKTWKVAPGEYQIWVGTSSMDLRASQIITIGDVKENRTVKEPVVWGAYASLKNNRFDKNAFQTLYGKLLPENDDTKQHKLTLNTPLVDFRKKFFGKIIFTILKKEITRHTTPTENEKLNEKLKTSMLEIPLQNLTNFSNGSLTGKTARALVYLANGEIAAGIKAFITK
ncbi:MAG: glycoside hydrolase family 3 C-terminal domain-containing protein [Anaerolineaceae bacterium]